MPEPIVMMSDILISIAWSIVLTPYQCQVITPTNPDFLWMELDDIVQMVFQMHFCDWKLVNFI